MGDRCGALGLDYRYPLLKFCLALPPEQYVRQGWTRYLFRRTIDALVPASLPWQRDKHDAAFVHRYGRS
jgi:asparagine synthase (glutamine-hydrolysing)